MTPGGTPFSSASAPSSSAWRCGRRATASTGCSPARRAPTRRVRGGPRRPAPIRRSTGRGEPRPPSQLPPESIARPGAPGAEGTDMVNDVLARLEPPEGVVRVVLDTDAYNEIDDQFAIAYAVRSPRLDVEAVYAAPFHNVRSSGPADGMRRSY